MKANDNNIGLDRVRIANCTVKAIDIAKFKANEGKINMVDVGGVEVAMLGSGEVIQVDDFYINITDIREGNDNSKIQLKLTKYKGDWIYSLSFNAPKLYHNTNLENISNPREVGNIPNMIIKHLEKVGVYIDLEKANVTYFEVNYNIYDDKFINAFRMINKCWKANKYKVFEVGTDDIESMKLKLSTREIKVYNKAKQLDDTLQFNVYNDVARVEVGATDRTNIKNVLGDRSLYTLCNNIEVIQKYYRKTITEHIKKPYEKYKSELMEYMIDSLNNGTKPSRLITDVCYEGRLVDTELYAKAIKQHYKEQGKGSPTRLINNQLKKLEETNANLFHKLQGNCDRIENFFKSIGV